MFVQGATESKEEEGSNLENEVVSENKGAAVQLCLWTLEMLQWKEDVIGGPQ